MAKRISRRRVLVVLFMVASVTGACGSDGGSGDDGQVGGPTFTQDGARFVVEPGEQFTVVLESNATTGYAWALSETPPREVVVLVDDLYVAPDTALVGVGGRQELTFEAVGDGSTFLQLWYVRAFDDPPAPAEQARFEVIVGSGGSGETAPPDRDEPQALHSRSSALVPSTWSSPSKVWSRGSIWSWWSSGRSRPEVSRWTRSGDLGPWAPSPGTVNM